MSFHFVDRIYHVESKKVARGLKNVTRSESFFYPLPTGEVVLSPAVVTEALAQLGSWLKMYSTDFNFRPVLLADEFTQYHAFVRPGDQIELHCEILDFDDEVVSSKSYATVNGRLVLSTACCRGYMLPIDEFDLREDVVRQFNYLYRPSLDLPKIAKSAFVNFGSKKRNDFSLGFVDGILHHDLYKKVIGVKNFSACEPFFSSHFPRKPVVPGVLLMSFIGELAQFLIQEDIGDFDTKRMLMPMYVKNASFRKFVEPGDQCTLTVEIIDGDCSKDSSDLTVSAVIEANGKRVMQGTMGFRKIVAEDAMAFTSKSTANFKDLGHGLA